MVITDVNSITYNGDGITTAWPYTFQIIDATDIRLTLVANDGYESDITSDYYVDTVNSTVYYPGYAPGSEPPEADQPPKVANGEKIVVYRQIPVTQEKDLGDSWPFYVIEKGLDKLTMLIQDVYDWIGRNTIQYVNGAWNARGFRIENVSGPVSVGDVATKDYVDSIMTGIMEEGDCRAIPVDTVAQLRATDFVAGQIASTLGYYDVNDGGGGTYAIRSAVPGDTDDGGSIIILNNGKVAELLVGDTIYLKQWGVTEDGTTDDTTAVGKAIAYATANSVAYVKCGGEIFTTSPINVAFNFEFNKIKYTGNSYALVIDSLQDKYVKGNSINATAGSGIKITCTTKNAVQNHVEVRNIEAYVNGVDILPVNSKGVMQNYYQFGKIKAVNGKGINSYIPANTGHYSWEGEDTFSVGVCSSCLVGVNFEIAPITGDKTDDGTITGINFLNLSCEYSTTGIRIKCGKVINTGNQYGSDATIKGITIRNFRCRETNRSTMFLDAEGLLKDIYIYPTSSIKLPQWRLISSYYNDCHKCAVIGQIMDYTETIEIGENLCSCNKITYIEKTTPRMIEITTASTDFGNMCKKYKDTWLDTESASDWYDKYLYMPSLIYVSSAVNSAAITLNYFVYESAQHIQISVANGKEAVLTIPRGGSLAATTETITNSSGARHLYDVQVYRYQFTSTTESGGTYRDNVRIRVVDLGAFTAF